MKDALFAVY